MSIGVVIPAAGQGKRMRSKKNKQYLDLLERPVLAHTISLFTESSLFVKIVVVVREDELDFCRENIIKKYFEREIILVAGGKTRRQSVFAGLQVFSPAIDYVIIHDGARPLLTKGLLKKVVEGVQKYQAVTVATRLKDTVKKINDKEEVIATPDREKLAAIQTPQAFNLNILKKAHKTVSLDKKITDDASLVEHIGYKVKVLNGSYENIKITTPIDLAIAKIILKKRKREGKM